MFDAGRRTAVEIRGHFAAPFRFAPRRACANRILIFATLSPARGSGAIPRLLCSATRRRTEKMACIIRRFPGRFFLSCTSGWPRRARQRRPGKNSRQRNSDLLQGSKSTLAKYYRDETIASPAAREHFVMPDRWMRGRSSLIRRFIRVQATNPRQTSGIFSTAVGLETAPPIVLL